MEYIASNIHEFSNLCTIFKACSANPDIIDKLWNKLCINPFKKSKETVPVILYLILVWIFFLFAKIMDVLPWTKQFMCHMLSKQVTS